MNILRGPEIFYQMQLSGIRIKLGVMSIFFNLGNSGQA